MLDLGNDKETKQPVGFISSVFDTGCQRFLSDSCAQKFLRNKTRSKSLIMQAISTKLTAAGYVGVVFMYHGTSSL